MQTWLINDHQPLRIDTEIVQALSAVDDTASGGGIAYNLGILAGNGQVYRVARAWDLANYQRATRLLERLGLVLTGSGLRVGNVSLDDVFRPAGQRTLADRPRPVAEPWPPRLR